MTDHSLPFEAARAPQPSADMESLSALAAKLAALYGHPDRPDDATLAEERRSLGSAYATCVCLGRGGTGEVLVLCTAIFGAGLGFLWFNTYPAQVFMGDIGALALGAALGVIAVIVRQEIVLFIMGGVFVMETVSVILQVGSFKLRGKRIFAMAPIHHHYELKGWAEPKVIVRFWIITVVLVLFGLATLKLR